MQVQWAHTVLIIESTALVVVPAVEGVFAAAVAEAEDAVGCSRVLEDVEMLLGMLPETVLRDLNT